jgi:hypothetical protein
MNWVSLSTIVSRAGATAGILAAIGVTGSLLFPDLIVNSLLKPRLVTAFTIAYPAHELYLGRFSVGILGNRVECDSIAIHSSDSSWSAHGRACVVSGLHLWSVFLNGRLDARDLATSIIEAKQVVLSSSGSDYELRFDSFRASVEDSIIAMTLVSWSPSCEDEQLFASHPLRHTRLRIAVPRIDMAGVACLDLLQGTRCQARAVRFGYPAFDILVNKEKPFRIDAVPPLMPAAFLSSIGIALRIDSVVMTHGVLHYGERFGVGWHPGVITLDSMQVRVQGMTNEGEDGDTILVCARGRFMNAGMMRVRMMIPLAHQGLTFEYGGSLSGMNLAALNPFLERAEQLRITDGVLREAAFAIVVTSGRARGRVRALYRDLTVAIIDGQTGSDEGLLNTIATLISNRVKIKGTNLPDRSGVSVLGVVRHDYGANETFVEFSWFALRSGVGDVVGF